MAIIMQGDAYSIPITGSGFTLSDVDKIEFTIGNLTKCYRASGESEVTVDTSGTLPVFHFPITQEESFALCGEQPVQARVHFAVSGNVIGARVEEIGVEESLTRTVL